MVFERLLRHVVCPNLAISVSRQLPEQVPVDPQEVDLAPHPVVGLALQVGNAEKFPQALGFEGPDPYPRVSQQGPCFTGKEDNGCVTCHTSHSNPG